ncbi:MULTISPECIES: DUF6455 family protein [unclassified Phaeobacter]|uniref:DUF6455 family protein n=1 Tax=unclassified Phaeobacter TaxID=2621772 RepID=UPI003A88538F
MRPLGDPLHHLRLMARMGQAAGVELSTALAAGRIPPEDWAAMITRCRSCDATLHCEAFLATRERSQAPMPGCRNADQLMVLRD